MLIELGQNRNKGTCRWVGEALGVDIRLDKRDIPIPGKYLDSECMLDQMDVFYTCFGIQAPFCASHQSCGLRLGPGYLLPLSRAGMMLTEGVSHFSERKGEDLEAGHDPLLPDTCVFSIMVKKNNLEHSRVAMYVRAKNICESQKGGTLRTREVL